VLDEARLAARLAAVPVAEMSDTLDAAGLPDRVLAAAFAPLGAAARFAGPAVCLSGEAAAGPGLPIAAVDAAIRPGAVVIVGPGAGCERALLGGNMVAAWRTAGMQALIVDGRVRDSADYADLPVHARGRSPLNCRGHWRFTAIDAPVRLPGTDAPVTVRPGDWILGDADGIVVLPRADALRLIEDAEGVGRIERQMRAAIQRGADRQSVYEGHARFAHVRRAGAG
jgi:4-hydroxy-4-methyl-2-oxoglutarate aldolase